MHVGQLVTLPQQGYSTVMVVVVLGSKVAEKLILAVVYGSRLTVSSILLMMDEWLSPSCVRNAEDLLAFRTAVIKASTSANESTYLVRPGLASLVGHTLGRDLVIWPSQARPRAAFSDTGSRSSKYDTMDSEAMRLLVSDNRVDIELMFSSNTIETIRGGKVSFAAFMRSCSGGSASSYTLDDHDG